MNKLFTHLLLLTLLVVLVSVGAVPVFPAEDSPRLVIDPQGHSALIKGVIFTPDGRVLISVSDDKTIRLWDAQSGELLKTLRGQVGDGPEGKLFAAALSPDGRTLAVGGYGIRGGDKPIHLYNIETGRQTGLLQGHSNAILALAFSRDGQRLASGSADDTARIWDVGTFAATGKPSAAAAVLEGHRDDIYGVAFSPGGDKMVSASYDHTLRLWQTNGKGRFDSANCIKMKKHMKEVYCVAWSPNGTYIVSGGLDHKILLWDADGNFIKEIDELSGIVCTVSFSQDGHKIVAGGSGNCEVPVYAIPSGAKLTRFTKHDNTVLASAFYRNNTIATAGGNDNVIYIWDAGTAEVKTHLEGKGKSVFAAAFGRGLHAAFGQTDSPVNYLNRGPLEKSFDFSQMALDREKPSDRHFTRTRTTCLGHTLERLNDFELQVKDGVTIKNDDRTDGWIRCYTFANNDHIVVGSDYSLKLYGDDGTFVRKFIGHTGVIWAVSVSGDGRILASASNDQTLKFWNIATGELLATLFVTADNEWVCWTPQGYYAASAGGEQYIGWHINRGINNAADFYPVYSYRDRYKNPQLVKRTIELFSFDNALAEYNAAVGRKIVAAPAPVTQPPTVLWQEPVTYRCKTGSAAQRIRARIDSTVKITRLKILVNGATAAIDSQITPLPGSTSLRQTIEYTVPLIPGPNRIEIFAANSDATATSDPRIVVYQNTDMLKPNLYVVVIGISQYKTGSLNLNYAHTDAREMGRLFKGQEGLLFREVRVESCIDGTATREDIIAALEWLERSATQKDVAVVFAAAHGRVVKGRYYLLPHDVDTSKLRSTAVNWENVFIDILGDLPCRRLMIMDTCHSGAIDLSISGRSRGTTVDNTEAVRELASPEYGVVVMAASTAGELSRERKEWGNGAFTKAFIEGVTAGKADSSGDGIIHLRELDQYISQRVKELTGGKQRPITQRPPGISRFPIFQVKGKQD